MLQNVPKALAVFAWGRGEQNVLTLRTVWVSLRKVKSCLLLHFLVA